MQRIKEDINSQKFSNMYLLFGEERYLRNQYADTLLNALCNEGDDMNTHRYEGKIQSIPQIIDLAETMPFLADYRVILLKDSGLFKAGGDELADYLNNCNSTTIFIFNESDVDKRCRLYKTVSSKGHAAEMAPPDAERLQRWVGNLLSKDGKLMSTDTFRYFLDKVDTNMENIRMEVEKLVCYVGDRDIIEQADVDAICSVIIEDNVFGMLDALIERKPEVALKLYYDLLTMKVPSVKTLSLIGRQYNTMLIAKTMKADGAGEREIATSLGIHPYVAKKLIARSTMYKTTALKRAVEECVIADERIKTGQMADTLSVEVLLMTLINL